MAEEQPTLAEKARAAIRTGQLPSRAPNRRFGGRGNGETCPVCGEVVTLIQAEIELEFNRHGPEPGLDRYHASRPVLHRWNEAVAFALVLGAVVVANLPA